MTPHLRKQLTHIIDIGVLQEVQDKFADATGLAVVIADKEGNALTRPSRFTALCKLMRSTPQGMAHCQRCDAALGIAANKTGEAVMAQCHAGLYDQAAPIVVDGEYLGSVLCGQVLLQEATPEWKQTLGQHLRTLGLDAPKGDDIFEDIVVISPERLRSEAGLLQIMAQYIVSIGLTSLNLRLLHEQNLNLMRQEAARIQLEHDLKAMELKALQSQVDPHFLFNTLNTIVRLAMMEGAKQAEQVTYALSRLLRYLMSNTGQEVSLEDEIAHVEEYLKIQKFRFGHRLKSHLRISQRAKGFQLPIMTLQPLVENALVHGLEPQIDGGVVTIIVSQIQDETRISVEDDGVGISPERLQEIQQNLGAKNGLRNSSGLGLSNVMARMQNCYGSRFSYAIWSEPHQGTRVTLKFRSEHEKAVD